MGGRGKEVLVVVHPGSACGSADFSMGLEAAALARYDLGRTIHQWNGDSIIISNEFHAETDTYAQIGLALQGLRDPILIDACASREGWDEEAFQTIRSMPADRFIITGAWHHPDQRSGCVDAIAAKMEEAGMDWEIATCALRL